METDDNATPQKARRHHQASGAAVTAGGCDAEYATTMTTTPGQCRKQRQHHQAYSPTMVSSSSSSCFGLQMASSSCTSTPPAKRFQRVKNPFEPMLADRLYLPTIESPSLFQQRAVNPQLSSTQFEWTIDNVSSLNPVNVEPHETQFHDSPDPEYEAKAQSAISSFFKDQKIVPSPANCPLRNQRIILSELNGNTPISKPGRRIRDCGTQTDLTLPWILPPALEEALRPYFQPVAESPDSATVLMRSAAMTADISLRRKLFDMQNVVVLGEGGVPLGGGRRSRSSTSTTNSSPLSVHSLKHVALTGKLSDSLDKSSFGSLSPISATSNSPQSPNQAGGGRTRHQHFLNDLDGEELSPIVGLKRERPHHSKLAAAATATRSRISLEYRSNTTITDMSLSMVSSSAGVASAAGGPTEPFTPDCSSSPMRCNAAEFSIDNSIQLKVSRLRMNSSKAVRPGSCGAAMDMQQDDTMDDGLLLGDDEDMQVSRSNSSNSDTPRGKRRWPSRNLSQSFSRHLQDAERDEGAGHDETDRDDDADDGDEEGGGDKDLFRDPSPILVEAADMAIMVDCIVAGGGRDKLTEANVEAHGGELTRCGSEQHHVKFFRTDSGFNDMTSSQTSTSTMQCSGEPLVRSSTPSKELALDDEDIY